MQFGYLHFYPPCHDAGNELAMRTKFTSRGVPSQTQHAGQAMVEFMLVTVFLLILFVSVLQMILLMHAYNTLADAAKEGVRYAIVHGTGNSNCSGPNSSAICTSPDTTGAKVVSTVTNFAALSFQRIQTGEVTVSYSANPVACSAPGCLVSVKVSHAYTPVFGLGWPKFTLYAAADGRIIN